MTPLIMNDHAEFVDPYEPPKRLKLRHTQHMPLAGEDGRDVCARCGAPLPSGRRRWCSDACRDDAARMRRRKRT